MCIARLRSAAAFKLATHLGQGACLARWTLLERLLLAAAFILWAIDQFLPSGKLAMLVGDAVVSAYVLDLFWIVQEQRKSRGGESHAEIEERTAR